MVLYSVFTLLSAICLLASLITIIKHIIEHSFGSSTAFVVVLLFLAIFFARYPVACDENNLVNGIGRFFSCIFNAIIHTLQSFTLDESYETLFEIAIPCVTLSNDNFIRVLYETYISLLNICAPIVTYSVLLTFLLSFINKITLNFSAGKEKIIFSQLNEKTLVMGEKVRETNKKCVIVYANTSVNSAEKESYKARLKSIYAICQSQSVEGVHFFQKKNCKITYILADDEMENFDKCSKLLKCKFLKDKLIVNIFVLSVSKSSEQLFANLLAERLNKNIRLYPIGDYNLLIYKMLIEYPLFLRADGEKFSAMIIGDSEYAYEAIKAFVWCGTFSYYDFTLHVVVEDVLSLKDRLEGECPELFSCNEYNIKFAQLTPTTHSFKEYLVKEASDVNYVFISNKSTALNIKTAINTCKIYDTLHLDGSVAPVCVYMVENDDLYQTLKSSKNVINECLATPFGNLSNCYDIKEIMDSALERMAMAVHLSYYKIDLVLSDGLIVKIKKLFCKGADFRLGENKVSDKYFIELKNKIFGKNRFKQSITSFKSFFFAKKMVSDKEFITVQKILATREQAIVAYIESIYGRNSSYASAVHALYRLYLAGIIKGTKQYTEEDLKKYSEYVSDFNNLTYLSKMEHHRWNAYMRTDGFRKPTEKEYEYMTLATKKHKSEKLRLHPCLVEWEQDKGMPLCDENLNVIPDYYALFNSKDKEFMSTVYNTQLDELDRVSLITSTIDERRRFEHKSSDAVIVKVAHDILRAAKNEGINV